MSIGRAKADRIGVKISKDESEQFKFTGKGNASPQGQGQTRDVKVALDRDGL